MHKIINTDRAPLAVGPYSQAIAATGSKLVFISGQIPLKPGASVVETTDIKEQTQLVLKNLGILLEEAGASIKHVVKTTVYLQNLDDFAPMNGEYERFFSDHRPARACVEVARLPKASLVEIDAIAVL